MIVQYNTVSDYTAAGKPVDDSRVARIVSPNEVMIDGINVVTNTPEMGDDVVIDAEKYMFIKGGDQLNAAKLPIGLTHIGSVVGWIGDKVLVLDKNQSNKKWCDVVQFSITAISTSTIKFWLKMAGDYATFVPIEVELSDSSNGYMNTTTASEITAALEAAGNTGNIGYDKHLYWAFLSNDADDHVESGGTKIIVQCDSWMNYQQYQCSDGTHALVGCTMVLSVWGDMPVNSQLRRRNGVITSWGNLNYAKSYAYRSVSGDTPTSNVAINAVNLVNKTSFDNSAYCADLRAYYGTYENYIMENMVEFPQQVGVFRLPDGLSICRKYANNTFTKKDGTIAFKYPAMHYAHNISYTGISGLELGNFYLPGVAEGTMIMDDAHISAQNATADKVGIPKVTNSASRWFSQRYNAYGAWYFSGTFGSLYYGNVNSSYLGRAVVLLKP